MIAALLYGLLELGHFSYTFSVQILPVSLHLQESMSTLLVFITSHELPASLRHLERSLPFAKEANDEESADLDARVA